MMATNRQCLLIKLDVLHDSFMFPMYYIIINEDKTELMVRT